MREAVVAEAIAEWLEATWSMPASPTEFEHWFGPTSEWLFDAGYDHIEFEGGAEEAATDPWGQGVDRYGHHRSVEVDLEATERNEAEAELWGEAWESTASVWRHRRIGVPIGDVMEAPELLAELLDTRHVVGAYGVLRDLPRDEIRAFDWPLTFAMLPDDDAMALGEELDGTMPSSWRPLARLVRAGVDTDEANFLLIPSGEIPAAEWVEGFRASIVLFGGPPSQAKIDWATGIGAGAVGFVNQLDAERVFELVRNMGHDQPLDVAFWVPPGADGEVVWSPETYTAGYGGDSLFADRGFVDSTYVGIAFDRLAMRVESVDVMAVPEVPTPGGALSHNMAPTALPVDLMREVRPRLREAAFDAESDEGAESGEIAAAVETALRTAGERPEVRRIQVRLSAMADSGAPESAKQFVRGVQNFLAVQIAPGHVDWIALDRDFPPEREPVDTPYDVELEVRVPDQDESMRRTIEVPVAGASKPASFAFFLPDSPGPHQVQITAWHRGRPVQRAVLEAHAVTSARRNDEQATFTATEVRGFDFGLEGPDYLTAEITRDSVRVVRSGAEIARCDRELLDGYLNTVQDRLADAGQFAIGEMAPEKMREALVDLASYGALLREALFGGPAPDDEFVQIDAHSQAPSFPLELLYDGDAPSETATVCDGWEGAAQAGANGCVCDPSDRETVCPLRFWAMGRSVTRSLEDAPLQPASRRTAALSVGSCLFGVSQRVVDQDGVIPGLSLDDLRAAAEQLGASTEASTWDAWTNAIEHGAPEVLIPIVHHESADSGPRSLELRTDHVRILDVDADYVAPAKNDVAPLALLLGCTTSVTDSFLEHPANQFAHAGAKVIFGTISEVFPAGAVPAAIAFLEAIDRGESPSIGELGRMVRRQLIASHNPVGLALCIHGDPEWAYSKETT